jgi:tRNA threonylcarbamoyladenosine biosynthesis protein TsaB
VLLPKSHLDPEIGVSALGIMNCVKLQWAEHHQIDVHLLEPLYIRNKVAFTTRERLENLEFGSKR